MVTPARDGGVQVIARAAAILRALRAEGLSLGALARATGLPRSTVQRIVDALAAESLVETGPDGVRPGRGLHSLAQVAQTDVAARVRPQLEALFDATHETVEFSVVHGRDAACLVRIVSDQAVRVVPASDRPAPLHLTASGTAILSCMEDGAVRALVEGRAGDGGAWPALSAKLAAVRRCGFAYGREEGGVCTVATAVAVAGMRPHAVALLVPVFRFEAELARYEAALVACRAELVAELSCG